MVVHHVLFVCLGNICRSPMAEGVLTQLLTERSLTGWNVDSAGTSGYHVGEPPDPRTLATLRQHGIPLSGRSRQVRLDDFGRFDVILAMDHSNLRALHRMAPAAWSGELGLALGDADVPDPYYGGPDGFEHVYGLLDAGLRDWLARHEA